MKKILMIDDEPQLLTILKLNLETTGEYEVTVETEGKKAAETAARVRPDLILLDMIMPDMDGMAVAKEIQKIEGLKQVPVAFMTATAVVPERGERPDSCIEGFPIIPKPVELDTLLLIIRELLA